MNVYLVRYKLKMAGYSEGDQATSGGYFDTHHAVMVPASSAGGALKVAAAYVSRTTNHPAVINRKPELLVENV